MKYYKTANGHVFANCRPQEPVTEINKAEYETLRDGLVAVDLAKNPPVPKQSLIDKIDARLKEKGLI